jgi:hypothetical protein
MNSIITLEKQQLTIDALKRQVKQLELQLDDLRVLQKENYSKNKDRVKEFALTMQKLVMEQASFFNKKASIKQAFEEEISEETNAVEDIEEEELCQYTQEEECYYEDDFENENEYDNLNEASSDPLEAQLLHEGVLSFFI